MENFTRLELFCRLFLGLFVGFFCVTAALFVRYKVASPLVQIPAVQLKSATQAVASGAPSRPVESAARLRPATPSLEPEERILITSSTSTLVTFVAAVVANLLSWRKGKRRRRPKESRAPSTRRST
ncbi:hypothetical protein [Paraburkholderia pallida]|uniref:Uncharacterized protein n=1 Tax=Paraburkholderia pallida TaxID=2547399 RepID=A0A4P7D767_9BURK|nr:hypothetical protein [Paraburkholderia pallida]QBR02930.1 hypothetical protein E1956_37660 [Paraburkholderia pallida]